MGLHKYLLDYLQFRKKKNPTRLKVWKITRVGLGKPIARGWAFEASSQSQAWGCPGHYNPTSPNTHPGCRVPATLGPELGFQLPGRALESPLPGAFGAGRSWLCISAPLPSCVTLGKSLRLSKPLFPPLQRGEDHLQAARAHVGGFHGVARQVLATQWVLRKSLLTQSCSPGASLASPDPGLPCWETWRACNHNCFYLTHVPGTALGARHALPHAHPPDMPMRKLRFREVGLLAQGHRASERRSG